MAAKMADKRGPKLGDAASLWNFTPSPGWTKDEAATLKLCLMALGVGRWAQIQACGLLPGKMHQQLNGQTQRLLGQQSLMAYTGLQGLDIDRIRRDNEAKGPEHERKGGLIIKTGPPPSKAVKDEWQAAARATYGLTPDQRADVEAEFRERVEAAARSAPRAATLMASDAAALDAAAKKALLARLHAKGEELGKLAAAVAGGAGVGAAAAASWARGAAFAAREAGAGAVAVDKEEAVDKPEAENAAAAAPEPADTAAAPAAAPAPAEPAAAGPSEPAAAGPSEPAPAPAPAPKKRTSAPAKKPAPKKPKKKKGGAAPKSPRSPALSAAIDTVAAMGFPRRKAAEALAEVGGDVTLALEWLCQNLM